jgi:SAM-dependent methyltransferase
MHALGWNAEGLDFDKRAIERAKAKGLVMHLGGLPEQRFPAASYDAVTMSHSIEHVHDPVGWLAEARRVLRPRGRLALATPNAHSLLHRRFGRNWFPLEPPRHLHLFNRAALESALRKAGFGRFRLFTSARDATGVFASRTIAARDASTCLRRNAVPALCACRAASRSGAVRAIRTLSRTAIAER